MKIKVLAIIHFLILILLLFWNYYANTGIIEGKTIGSLSDKYDSLFTPASYAFAIWGVIYLGLLAYGINLLYVAFLQKGNREFIIQSAPWISLAHIGNALWVYTWLSELLVISVVVMIAILTVLLVVVIKLRMEKWDAPLKVIVLQWWPIDLYVGWISVALVANVSAYLSSLNFTAGLDEVLWTMIMIGVVTMINLLMIILRNMREFAAVGIWALIAIAVRHCESIPEIQWSATIAAVILAVASALHAYKNRATLPFVKREIIQS